MNMNKLIHQAGRFLRKNSPSILAGMAVTGTVATAYLSGKATVAAVRQYDAMDSPPEDPKEIVKTVYRHYIPAATVGVVTIGCIISGTRIGNRRSAAYAAAYSLSEKAYSEYREKVTEKYGERKEQQIRDEIAQEKVHKNPAPETLVVGTGQVLCCESFTGRYFSCDMESLRKAQNDINSRIVSNDHAYLADFYYIVGLPYTSYSNEIGWDIDRLLELEFSTVLTEDNRPCLTFEYNYTKPI